MVRIIKKVRTSEIGFINVDRDSSSSSQSEKDTKIPTVFKPLRANQTFETEISKNEIHDFEQHTAGKKSEFHEFELPSAFRQKTVTSTTPLNITWFNEDPFNCPFFGLSQCPGKNLKLGKDGKSYQRSLGQDLK